MYMLVPNEPHIGVHRRGGDLRHRDVARLRQPFAGRPRRVRRRHADRALGVRRRGAAGRPADLPAALLHPAVHAGAGGAGHSRIQAAFFRAARWRRR